MARGPPAEKRETRPFTSRAGHAFPLDERSRPVAPPYGWLAQGDGGLRRARGDGQFCDDGRAAAVGVYFEAAPQLRKALFHSPQPDARAAGRPQPQRFLRRHALAFVAYLDGNLAIRPGQSDVGYRTLRVTVDIGEAFLY